MSNERQVLKNLQNQHSLLRRALIVGIIDASSHVEFFSNELAPRDTGFLRMSSTIVEYPENKKDVILGGVGYTAEYAAYVHEMPETNNFTTEGTGPKFLERAPRENRDEINESFISVVKGYLKTWQV
jgi:hypothetical protein